MVIPEISLLEFGEKKREMEEEIDKKTKREIKKTVKKILKGYSLNTMTEKSVQEKASAELDLADQMQKKSI
ncbi:hypothetical protein Q3G72_020889 [Acer saccharum]|nr:hypothetical protein Q3G72_020889 [Acer saccharum]